MELHTLGYRKRMRLAFGHAVHSIKRMNQKHKNEAKNQALQSVMFKMLQEEDEAHAKKVLVTLCELYRRKVWFDDRTANVICTASFHPASELDLRTQKRHSLAYSPADRGHFKITSFDACPDSSDLIFVGRSDRFGRLYDRRMLRLGCTWKKGYLLSTITVQGIFLFVPIFINLLSFQREVLIFYGVLVLIVS